MRGAATAAMRARKTLLAASLVFALALVAALTLGILTSRHHAQRELGERAQEAATGLATALETRMHDRIAVETLVSALFDRGRFAAIGVVASDGRTLAYRELRPQVPGVPEWFRRLVALDPPPSEAMVTLQWRQLGRVIVVSHPHHAYVAAWRNAMGLVAIIAAAYAAMLGLLRRAIRTQASAPGERSSAGPAMEPVAVVPVFDACRRPARLP